MTDNQEFNATSVEEAVEKASRKLGLAKEDLPYEVLDTGSSGFLGMGSRDARIMVTSDPSAEETAMAPETMAPETRLAEQEDGVDEVEDDNDSATFSTAPVTKSEEAPNEEHSAPPEDLLNDIRQFVSHSVDTMGLEARIDVYDAGDFIAVDVTSAETGLFIGQKGETIDAFQYLLNVAIYRDIPYLKRIIVDSEGYRQRRVEAVQGIAHRMARKAIRENRVVELPPMNTSERRIVHLFLRDNDQVSTTSQGSGEGRRVTVSPSS